MLYFRTAASTRAVRVNRRSQEALMGRLLEEETREIRADLKRAGLM